MSENNFPGFAFQFIDFPTYTDDIIINKKPFIEHVERVLTNNLQSYDSFGCKINNCHTHAGSKMHFKSFIEAELLFHNSYYNKAFAKLTFDWIFSECALLKNGEVFSTEQNNNKIQNIVLIGYETYSELYLQDVREQINSSFSKLPFCGISVYETTSKTLNDGSRETETSIRNLTFHQKHKVRMECDNTFKILNTNNTLFVFVVPINTSLSTMDKMIAKFCEQTHLEKEELNSKYLCLITLYNAVNSFFDINKTNGKNQELKAKNKKFEYLDEKTLITNFVLIDNVDAFIAKKCNECYPDKNNIPHKSILDEKPIFGVNRGSVVPMLKIGHEKYLEPINQSKFRDVFTNFEKTYELSEFMIYKHITRGDNHFQYYFDTNKFLEKYKLQIELFLQKLKDKYKSDNPTIQTFDFLVAPRHQSNAGWVHIVNKHIFEGNARILYFDVDKEYRSNIKAKYSDIISTLDNIQKSGEKFLIRFHFVDDVIQSGETIIRVKSLLTSLTSVILNRNNISFFDSILLLINRLSVDSRRYYIENNQRCKYFYYVDVNISPMRSHEDACTLCKLIADYYTINKECALNELSDICYGVINRHQITSPQDSLCNRDNNIIFYSQNEKRYLFFITHMLNERFANKFYLKTQSDVPYSINIEHSNNEIIKILSAYYEYKNINAELKFLQKDEIAEKLWKIAFIKSISRPFLTYHLRIRQSAFSFCLYELDKAISCYFSNYSTVQSLFSEISNVASVNENLYTKILKKIDFVFSECMELILIQTLVKACSDMTANYIIRKNVLTKLVQVAKEGDLIYKKIDEIMVFLTQFYNKNDIIIYNLSYILNNIFTSSSLLHYIKKDIVLSRDVTKSLLLEHILINNNENSFFDNETIKESKIGFLENDETISVEGLMYLENNTIIKKILGDKNNLEKLIKESIPNENICRADHLYFFETLKEFWNLNYKNNNNVSVESFHKCFCMYRELVDAIDNFANKNANERKDISCLINSFFNTVVGNKSLQSLVFVHDNNEQNLLFQFFTIAGDPSSAVEELNNCKYQGLKITQAFFHDDNINAINEKIKENYKDIFFVEDYLTKNNQNRTIVVRFDELKKNHINKASKSSDESIYIQIWGFETENIKHWFALKLLLTLRENFINLIKKVNLNGLIEERKVEMQKIALSINKATTHSKAERYYMSYPFTEGISNYKIISSTIIKSLSTKDNGELFTESEKKHYEGRLALITDKANRCERQSYDAIMKLPSYRLKYRWTLFDKYYQLLSDELLSSFYRKAVTQNIDIRKSTSSFLSAVTTVFDPVVEEDEVYKSKACITMHDGNGEMIECEILFECDESNPKGEIQYKYNHTCNINVYIFIVILMAMNSVEHGATGVDGRKSLHVYLKKNLLSFVNNIDKNTWLTSSKDDRYWHIPPWVFNHEDQHVTIWTLLHMNNHKNINGIHFNPHFDEKKQLFIADFIFKGD